MRRTRAGIAVVLAMLVLSLTSLINPGTASAEDDDAAACLAAGNVWVVVQDYSGTTGGCATEFGDGLEALRSAGFTVTEMFPGFICQLNGAPAVCNYEPDFWSYWTLAQDDDGEWGDWVFSNDPADGSMPEGGTVEGWRLVPLTGDWDAPDYTPPAVTVPTPTAPPGTPVTIPDAGLKSCLAAQLRQQPTAPITDEQLATITELTCFFGGILDLTGAQYLTSVTSLDLTFNDIVDLTPLAGLTQLTTLVLDSNDIVDLTPLAGLTGLRTLDLDYNRISNLSPLSTLTGLTTLTLTSQQKVDGVSPLSSLAPVSSLVNLTELGVSGNAITDLGPVASLTGLQKLVAYSNQLSDLTVISGLPALVELNVHTNRLTTLAPLAGLTKLTNLNARNNQLTTLAGLPTSLVNIDLGNNPTLTDHSRLAALTNLTDLGLENTALSDVAFINQLPRLNYLIAHNNQIRDLSAMAGRTWRGWGVLRQAATLDATAETVVDLGLRDQTGAVINPDVLRLPDGVIGLGNGTVMFTEPGTYAIAYAESSSGGTAKFAGTLTVTVVEAQVPSTPPSSEPPTSEPPTSEPPTSEAPTSQPPSSEQPSQQPSTPAPTSEPSSPQGPTTPPTSRPLPETGGQAAGLVGLVGLFVVAGLAVARRVSGAIRQ
ncbi:leucine-rich repeat domain-containing protein [Aestuariimicrobium sp. Y1814]|uniref:leucine-rich repeat domain-containing protein n=1 Tax=Aestuariimicrobium sp. Y1814 TaxID=3418742 RepID=UPI003DA74ACB